MIFERFPGWKSSR